MRLIDADALLERMCRQCNVEMAEQPCEPDDCFVRTIIKYDTPTIDAVPVVRCKDCKHYHPANKSVRWDSKAQHCNRSVTMKFSPDGFCSFGERKDGDGNG